MFTHICAICGDEFQSSSNRAKYCVYCRDKAQVLRNKAYAEKKKAGLSIAIGSTQICPECNNTYIVTSGSQKCCKDCRKKHNNKQKISSNQRYTKDNYDSIIFYVPKGEREALKDYAQSQGISVNKLIQMALKEYKEKYK